MQRSQFCWSTGYWFNPGLRCWARAFGLILGWSWLLTGSIGLITYAFVLPKILATVSVGGPTVPPVAKLVILIVGLAFSAVRWC